MMLIRSLIVFVSAILLVCTSSADPLDSNNQTHVASAVEVFRALYCNGLLPTKPKEKRLELTWFIAATNDRYGATAFSYPMHGELSQSIPCMQKFLKGTLGTVRAE